MKVFIEFEDKNNQRHRTYVSNGENLVVGSSRMADLVLPGNSGLSAQHFSIQNQRTHCVVRNVSDDQTSVEVNGKVVVDGRLQDGDVVRVGGTIFRIQIESDEARANPGVVPPRPELSSSNEMDGGRAGEGRNAPSPDDRSEEMSLSETKVSFVSKKQRLHPAILKRSYSSNRIESFLSEVLFPILAKIGRFHLMINYQRLGVELPRGLDESANWLHDYSGDFGAENSLYHSSEKDFAILMPILSPLLSTGSGFVLGISDLEPEEFRELNGVSAAFYCFPEGLDFQIKNSSEAFGLTLMKNMSCLLAILDNRVDLFHNNQVIDDSEIDLPS